MNPRKIQPKVRNSKNYLREDLDLLSVAPQIGRRSPPKDAKQRSESKRILSEKQVQQMNRPLQDQNTARKISDGYQIQGKSTAQEHNLKPKPPKIVWEYSKWKIDPAD